MSIERYRNTMSGDVLHSWAADAQIEIDGLKRELAELRAKGPSLPDGWVAVPVEPTLEMCLAAYRERDLWPSHRCDNTGELAKSAFYLRYIAAINARPTHPITTEGSPDVE